MTAITIINIVVVVRRPVPGEATTRWTLHSQSRCRGCGLCCWAVQMCTPAGSMVVMVRLPCGEGTSLEYNRSLGSGYVSNKEEREKVGWKE